MLHDDVAVLVLEKLEGLLLGDLMQIVVVPSHPRLEVIVLLGVFAVNTVGEALPRYLKHLLEGPCLFATQAHGETRKHLVNVLVRVAHQQKIDLHFAEDVLLYQPRCVGDHQLALVRTHVVKLNVQHLRHRVRGITISIPSMFLNSKNVTVQHVDEEVGVVFEVGIIEVHKTTHVLNHAAHVVYVQKVFLVEMFGDAAEMRQPGSPLSHAIDDNGRVLPPCLVHTNTLFHVGFATVFVKFSTLSSGDGEMLVQWSVVLRCKIKRSKVSTKSM